MPFLRLIIFPTVLLLFYQNCSPYHTNGEFVESSLNNNEVQSLLKCSPGDFRNPKATALKKMNRYEYENTLQDIFTKWLSADIANNIMTQLKPLLIEIPKEKSFEGMNQTDQSVSLKHVESYIGLADKIAAVLTQNNSYLSQILNCTSPDSQACVEKFIKNFGRDLFRRPVTQEDIEWYYSVYQGHSSSYRNLIAAMFSSPQFVFLLEFGSDFSQAELGQETVWLNPYERASKLSYFLMQSTPDDTLYTAAANGSLMTDAGIKLQVDRLLSLPKVQRRIADSFANQWMKLEDTPLFENMTPALQSLLGSLQNSESIENRRKNMNQEVKDYFYYMIWEQNSTYQELMTSDLVFPRSAELAEIYGVPVWNGSYSIENLVRAPSNERAGLLTRAQFLFSGTESTRSIMRGVHVYRNYLCGEIPAPADNGAPEGLVFEDHFSEREMVETMTEQPGSSCVGCHQKLINPLGFPFESYDAFGMFRSQEKIFHPNASSDAGSVLTVKPVDTKTEFHLKGVVEGEILDGVDLARGIAKSTLGGLCFDQKLFSFALKQNIHFGEVDCAIQDIYTSQMNSAGSIKEAIRAIATQPEFLKRTLQ